MRNEQYLQPTTQTHRVDALDILKKTDTLNLREFGRTLTRRKRMILLITAVTLALALLLTALSTPLYRATATIQIERESSKVIGFDAVINSGDIRDTRDFYQTQFELMTSRTLAKQVIEKLKLATEIPSTSLFRQSNTPAQQTELEDALLENLSVEPVKNSRLVAISYVAPDPVEAAEIVNTVVETFKAINDAKRSSHTETAAQQLQTSIDDLKEQLNQAEQNLQTHLRQHQITVVNNVASIPLSAALQQREVELIQVQQERRVQEQQYTIFNDNQRQWGERLSVLPQDASVAALRKKLQKLDQLEIRKKIQATATVIAQIEALVSDINADTARISASLNQALSTSKNKESALRAEIDAAKQTQAKALSEYQILQQEFLDQRELYQSLRKRLAEINLVSKVTANNTVIVDPAEPPLKKFKPKLSSNLLFGGLLGVLLGLSAAFMREFLDDTVKDINTLERATHLPVLGVIAESTGMNSRQLATVTLSKPRSVMAEAFRSLRTSLRLSHQHSDTPVITITSATPNEGKTITACNLACAYASLGNRVLLIDADLRNPSLHKVLGISTNTGLGDYLSGTLSDSRDAIQITDIPNLYLLTAGSLTDDPAELLASPQMRILFDNAKQAFDQIIVDSPPVLGLADALIIAAQASATLVTVRAENTRMVVLNNALIRLRRAQAPLVGIALNRVDLNNRYGDDYGGYIYETETQNTKPTVMRQWLNALKKL